MTEKVLQSKKNGMLVLIAVILLYIVAALGTAIGVALSDSIIGIVIMVICIAYLCLGWIILCGLKVLKPQEALVLTLFGKYATANNSSPLKQSAGIALNWQVPPL